MRDLIIKYEDNNNNNNNQKILMIIIRRRKKKKRKKDIMFNMGMHLGFDVLVDRRHH